MFNSIQEFADAKANADAMLTAIAFLVLLFVCVYALHPSQQFSIKLGDFPVFLGSTSTKQSIKCLAHGLNTVPLVSLKPVITQSQV